MIVSKRTVGGTKKGGPFVQGTRLVSVAEPSSVTSWVLSNSKVTFTFRSCPISGVYLHSWRMTSGQVTHYNQSKALWCMNLRRTTLVNAHDINDINVDRYEVYPTKKYLVYPDTRPRNSGGTKSFEFVWTDVKYDTRNPRNTANITVTVSLGFIDDFVDIKLKLKANQSYPVGGTAEDSSTVTVSSVNVPSLIIKEAATEQENDNRIMSVPILQGHTYANPNKYLKTPRFADESFQYNYQATRNYLPGQPLTVSPYAAANGKKANFGSPGWMSMPVIIWGDKR